MTEIATLKKSDGNFTTNLTETLDELIDTLIPSRDTDDINYDCNDFFNDLNHDLTDDVVNSIINPTTVTAAVKGFKPYKAPGTDGIRPALLNKGLDLLMPHLIKIFKTSLYTGKLADSWLDVRTVFIPKPGKDDYSIAKSFIPIPLMSFLLKTLMPYFLVYK